MINITNISRRPYKFLLLGGIFVAIPTRSVKGNVSLTFSGSGATLLDAFFFDATTAEVVFFGFFFFLFVAGGVDNNDLPSSNSLDNDDEEEEALFTSS